MRFAARDLGFAVGLRLTRMIIRLAGFRRAIALARRLPPSRRPLRSKNAVAHWSQTIARVGGRPYGGTCLDRSVFLWWLMRVRGLDGRLRIGVVIEDGQLDAHAWVEQDGIVVNDDPAVTDRFEVFDEDPAALVFS